MICKRLRLNERRYKPPPEYKEGPIVRPCSLMRAEQTIRDGADSTPRLSRLSRRSDDRDHNQSPSPTATTSTSSTVNHQNVKTPLILITLSIPPEAKTLVPKYIKRDPRKQPPFCQQYMTLTKSLTENNRRDSLPDIYIRGFEILENNKLSVGGMDRADEILYGEGDRGGEPIIDSMGVQMVANEHIYGLTPEFMFNFDGYEMDNYGHLPGDTRTPTPMAEGFRPFCVRRTPSPNTKQIIRVDVKVNRKNKK